VLRFGDSQPLGERGDQGIRGPEVHVVVPRDQFGHARVVGLGQVDQLEGTLGDAGQETRLALWSLSRSSM
jgi:hypothetical protein